ncbi:unnamed protein product [Cuscuta europaea]|uniref:Uncharacterized protein n=1 Tax=Cuscuta europaea TaxID=41803 RepID=A0A9P1E828_CUSEU|nr:unnamed protein product [Cuscuta europaea]
MGVRFRRKSLVSRSHQFSSLVAALSSLRKEVSTPSSLVQLYAQIGCTDVAIRPIEENCLSYPAMHRFSLSEYCRLVVLMFFFKN